MKSFKVVAIILSVLLFISCVLNIKLVVFVLQNYNTVKMGIKYVDYISKEALIELPSAEYSTDILFMDAHDWWFGEGKSAAVIGLDSSENERFLKTVKSDFVRWDKLSNMSANVEEHLFAYKSSSGYWNKSILSSKSGYYCLYNKRTGRFNEVDYFDKYASFIYVEYIPQDSVIYIHEYDD